MKSKPLLVRYFHMGCVYNKLLEDIVLRSFKAGEKTVFVSTRQILKMANANPSFSMMGSDEVIALTRYLRYTKVFGFMAGFIGLSMDVPSILKDEQSDKPWKKEAMEDIINFSSGYIGGKFGQFAVTSILEELGIDVIAGFGWVPILFGLTGTFFLSGIINEFEGRSFFG